MLCNAQNLLYKITHQKPCGTPLTLVLVDLSLVATLAGIWQSGVVTLSLSVSSLVAPSPALPRYPVLH